MNRFLLKSLRARLVIGAAIWISIGVYAAGIFIAELFRQYATSLVDSDLRRDLDELMMLIDVDASGFPHLPRPLSDPLFGQAGSGFSWQVSRSGKTLIKSLSASAEEVPTASDVPEANDVRKLTLHGVRGPMTVFERLFLPDDGVLPPLRIQVGAELAVIDRMTPTFTVPLAMSLALLALVLVAAAALQVSFGLRPMSRVRRALGEIGSGAADKLPEDFPSEVQPLVDDLNDLIEVNSQMLMRARAQAGNLGHGLKTPLAILMDEAYRLQRRGETEAAGVILQQSQRMQRQIDYQIARARAAASCSAPGVFAQLAPTIGNIVAAMGRLHGSRNLHISTDVDAQCAVQCDPMDLNEMTANLIDNACKWASEAVTIRGFLENGKTGVVASVVITVEDDGPGLPAEALERVFKIGERLDDQVPGSGLGLPIVRDLARLYGGEIQLNNSAGGGLRATLRLPAARARSDAAAPYPVSDEGFSQPGKVNRFFDRPFMASFFRIKIGRDSSRSKAAG
jgi:signal transduction histidine kinase